MIDFAERATRGGDGAPPPKPALEHSDALETVTTPEELEAALASAGGKLVVLDFGAGWCKKCNALMPKMEGYAAQYGAAVTFLAVDVEEAEDMALDMDVTALPRIFFYKVSAWVPGQVGASLLEKICSIYRANHKWPIKNGKGSSTCPGAPQTPDSELDSSGERAHGGDQKKIKSI